MRRVTWAITACVAVLAAGTACGGSAPERTAASSSSVVSETVATTAAPPASGTIAAQTSAATSPRRRFEALDALVKAIVALTREGSPKLEPEDIFLLSPRMSEPYFTEVDADLAVAQPLDGGCGWFVARDHHQIALGFSPGEDCATASVPQLTLDGTGIPWGPEALEHVDQIATGLASRLSDWAVQAVLQLQALPTPADVANEFPGLEFVDVATSVGQAAVALTGPDVFIAVRGQSGNCYLIHTSVSSHTVVQYGVAPECTPDAAARLATLADWPS